MEVPRAEAEERLGNKADNEPYLDIPISPEEPGTKAVREGNHQRIQAEIQYKAKEAETMTEEILDTPPA